MSDALPRGGRLAAIDYGTVRIGVAITDPDQRLASPSKITRAAATKPMASGWEACQQRADRRLCCRLARAYQWRRKPKIRARQGNSASGWRELTSLPVAFSTSAIPPHMPSAAARSRADQEAPQRAAGQVGGANSACGVLGVIAARRSARGRLRTNCSRCSPACLTRSGEDYLNAELAKPSSSRATTPPTAGCEASNSARRPCSESSA